MLINGGGAAGLTTFLAAVWDKDPTGVLRSWVVAGIAVLLLGVAIAASIYLFRYVQFVKKQGTPTDPWFRLSNRVLPGFAISCFVIGMGLAVVGTFKTLPDVPDETISKEQGTK